MTPLTSAGSSSQLQPTRGRIWWVLLGGVAVAQLCAFWLVCSQQVRRAEARHNEQVVQQMALSDCLEYIPGSTIASCTTRQDASAAQPVDKPVDNPALTGAVPVSFSYR
jgi:hypothetical protein